MKSATTTLLSGTFWTTAAFGLSQILRVASSVILTRLLSPELFGIMVIVYGFRTGLDLLSDVGIAQSFVTNKNSDKPEFYNTAWTLRFIRGIALWLLLTLAAIPIAYVYQA